jgi:hypothetical protein
VLHVKLSVANLGFRVVDRSLCRLLVRRTLFDILDCSSVVTLKFLSTVEFAIGKHEPSRRCLKLGLCLSKPYLVWTRVDREERITLVDNVSILEKYSRKGAADLSAQFNLVDCGELSQEAQPRVEFPHERLAHRYVWE